MHWNVALLTPPYSTLTYAVPDYFADRKWSPCHRVCVPLGNSRRPGILISPSEKQDTNYNIKPFFWPIEQEPLISPDYMELIFDLGRRQLKTPGEVLAFILPAGLRSLNLTLNVEHPEFSKHVKFKELFQMEDNRFQKLLQLWKSNRVYFIQNSSGKEQYVCIAKNPPWNLRPRAYKQIELMNYLWKRGSSRKTEIIKEFGNQCFQVLKSLENKGLIVSRNELYSQEDDATQKKQGSLEEFVLNSEQEEVYNTLLRDLETFSGKIRLLHGVTGSGKTLVYFLLARQCMLMGRSVLILVPEVALALQLWKQAEKYLKDKLCVLYHGYLSRKQREDNFQRVAWQQTPCIVIGTRSAVFLPRTDWGLIVIDEEHDSSFKQEERFQYQAKEVAFFLARQYKGMLLMGSATPDIKTFYSAVNDYFPLLRLNNRVGESCLPQVDVVNLHKEPQVEGSFSSRVREEMQNCLSRGEQAIILLNRRGYSPLVYCTDCGNVINCNFCQVGMTYHKNLGRVVCHYCGMTRNFPLPCPECGSHQFVPISEGTEQVEEFLSSYLDPGTGILRLDRDNTKRQGSMEEILDSFSKGNASVMVGTQMCSKGHHFPNVTLVVVLDGDVGLNLPDYRATEKTFQLLTQVSGRAGRGDKAGKVLIQTYNPNHYCWRYIVDSDYEGFFNQEIKVREKYKYPPFIKLALLRMNFPVGWSRGMEYIQDISKRLRHLARNSNVQVLGPAPSPLRQLRGRTRYQCLLKSPDWKEIRSLCSEFLYKYASNSKFRISLDLDPVQML